MLGLFILSAILLTANGLMCPEGFKNFHQSCYAFIRTQSTWTEAQAACLALNSFLAEVHTFEESDFLSQEAIDQSLNHIWVGGTRLHDMDDSTGFIWARSQVPFGQESYLNWGSGQPNNLNGNQYCVKFVTDNNGYLDDNACTQKKPFICQQFYYRMGQ